MRVDVAEAPEGRQTIDLTVACHNLECGSLVAKKARSSWPQLAVLDSRELLVQAGSLLFGEKLLWLCARLTAHILFGRVFSFLALWPQIMDRLKH
jgi:hypothetical protein